MEPVEVLWDRDMVPPLGKGMGLVEVLWDGDRVPPPTRVWTDWNITSHRTTYVLNYFVYFLGGSVFVARQRSGSKLNTVFDAEGNEIEVKYQIEYTTAPISNFPTKEKKFTLAFFHLQVETREDEEQNVKLNQTIELLLAAGYFRARIKGLSPFDKVISWI